MYTAAHDVCVCVRPCVRVCVCVCVCVCERERERDAGRVLQSLKSRTLGEFPDFFSQHNTKMFRIHVCVFLETREQESVSKTYRTDITESQLFGYSACLLRSSVYFHSPLVEMHMVVFTAVITEQRWHNSKQATHREQSRNLHPDGRSSPGCQQQTKKVEDLVTLKIDLDRWQNVDHRRSTAIPEKEPEKAKFGDLSERSFH